MLSLSAALEAFDTHGLRAQNDRLIDIPDMITVLTALYEVNIIIKFILIFFFVALFWFSAAVFKLRV